MRLATCCQRIFFRAALVVASVVSPLDGMCRSGAEKHAEDFIQVFDGYDDYSLRQFYKKFSSDIDKFKDSETSDSITARIKRYLASKQNVSVSEIHLKKHRYIAHQWPYQGAIPREDLLLIEKDYPGATEGIVRIWQQFCREKNDYIANEFALQRSPWLAKSYCAIIYYTHLLGDWLPPPENKDFDFVMSIDRIVDGILSAVREMGRSEEHVRFSNELEKSLKAAKAAGGSSSQQQAVRILDALKAAKLGTMLHSRFGKYMDESRHPYTEKDAQPQSQKAA